MIFFRTTIWGIFWSFCWNSGLGRLIDFSKNTNKNGNLKNVFKSFFSKQDGDGIEEILVGAPLFTNNEESRLKNKVYRAQCYITFRRFFRHLPPLLEIDRAYKQMPSLQRMLAFQSLLVIYIH
jgi:hypothetical protein